MCIVHSTLRDVATAYTGRFRVQYNPITMKKTKKIFNWILTGIGCSYLIIIFFLRFSLQIN